jgi:RNA polymerase sigma factor (sigma-70 family)
MNPLPDDALPALRRFAHGLLYDRDRAEDVVQEAWLAALRKQPPAHALGGWLKVAARNFARGLGREEARRSARERSVARPEALPSAAETAAQLELLRRLLDALEALAEPARTIVRLRHLEGLTPREIARRLGLPAERVRDQLHRGLAQLRHALDRGGRREEFLALLGPLAGARPWLGAGSGPLATLGVVLVKNKVLVALVLALLLGGLWLTTRGSSAPEERAGERTTAALDAARPVEPPREPAPAASPAAAARESVGADTRVVAATWIVRGHAFRGPEDFPGLALRGRVFAGIGPDELLPGELLASEVLAEGLFTTDENGDFAWPLAPFEQTVTVCIEGADDEAPLGRVWDFTRAGDPAPESLVVVAYPLDAWLAGVVRGPDGAPVPGAHVAWGWTEARADAEGRFELRASSFVRSIRLEASAGGFGHESVELSALAAGERRAVEFRLAPELRVLGRVLDEAGAPVPGTRVESWQTEAETISDEAGRFELGGWSAREDRIGLSATKDGYATAYANAEPVGRTSLELELVLERGRRLAGRVVDETGTPLEGVYLGAADANSNERESAWSDAEGRFELLCVPKERARLVASRDGYGVAILALDPAAIEQTELELVLTRGHFLEGTVVDPSGAPLPWALVRYEADAMLHDGADYTDAEGRFRFEGLPDRPVTVECWRNGFASSRMQTFRPDQANVVLRMEPLGAFAGRVVDASGAPISSFVVRLSPAATSGTNDGLDSLPQPQLFASPDGRFFLADDFARGKLGTLEVSAEGYAPAKHEHVRSSLAPDADALVFELVRDTRVRGRILARDTGEPLAGVRVYRVEEPLHGWGPSPKEITAVSDAEGRFELVNLPTGTTWLELAAEGWPAAFDGPFELGGAAVERRIELGRGTRLVGRLLDAAGTGLTGEELDLNGLEIPGATRDWRATSGADGAFAFEGMPAGLYHLRWVHRAGEVQAFDLLQLVRLAEDETKTVELRPEGRAIVRGTILFEGEPGVELPPFVSVMLFDHRPAGDSDEPMRWARSGRGTIAADGRFELGPIDPGAHSASVHFDLPGGGFAMGGSGLFEVPEEGVIEIVVRAERRR